MKQTMMLQPLLFFALFMRGECEVTHQIHNKLLFSSAFQLACSQNVNLTARINVLGQNEPLRQVGSVDMRIEGLGNKNKIIYTLKFLFGHLGFFPERAGNGDLRLIARETIVIPSKNNPFKAQGRRARVLIKFNCLQKQFDKKRIDEFSQLILTSPELADGSLFAFKAVCGVDSRAKRYSFYRINRNTFKVEVKFFAPVPESFLQQVTVVIIRVRDSTTVYPPYVLGGLNRDTINGTPTVYGKQTFDTLRKYNPFVPRLTLTSEFKCKDKSSQGRNFSRYDFTLTSFELGKRFSYRALETCGIQRKALFVRAGESDVILGS